MLTREKVNNAMQTLPSTFTAEELFQLLLQMEGHALSDNDTDHASFAAELELEAEGSTENFKEWASLT